MAEAAVGRGVGEESAACSEYRTLPHPPEFDAPPALDDRLMMEFITWGMGDLVLWMVTILEKMFPGVHITL